MCRLNKIFFGLHGIRMSLNKNKSFYKLLVKASLSFSLATTKKDKSCLYFYIQMQIILNKQRISLLSCAQWVELGCLEECSLGMQYCFGSTFDFHFPEKT